jgi:hypothetical protein
VAASAGESRHDAEGRSDMRIASMVETNWPLGFS